MRAKKKDDYEADFMAGDDALFREKHVSRIFAGFLALPALAAVAGALGLAASSLANALPALIMLLTAAFITTVALFFAVMRTTVSEEQVRVQYGMYGPSIDVASITHHERIELSMASKLIFGPKMWPEGWRYIPPGAQAGVRITWRAGDGEKTCTIGANDAAGLFAAISDARARASAVTGVRVEVDEPREEEEELETKGPTKKARGKRAG